MNVKGVFTTKDFLWALAYTGAFIGWMYIMDIAYKSYNSTIVYITTFGLPLLLPIAFFLVFFAITHKKYTLRDAIVAYSRIILLFCILPFTFLTWVPYRVFYQDAGFRFIILLTIVIEIA